MPSLSTPGPTKPAQCAPPCSLPAAGSVQENHTTWSWQTIKPILFLAALPRKEVQARRKEFWGAKHKRDFIQLILLAIFTTLKIKFHSARVCAGQQSPTSEQIELLVQRDVGAALHFQYHCSVNKALQPFYQSVKYCLGIPLKFNNRHENKLFLVSCQSSVKHKSQEDPPMTHC